MLRRFGELSCLMDEGWKESLYLDLFSVPLLPGEERATRSQGNGSASLHLEFCVFFERKVRSAAGLDTLFPVL